jgi:hypothetical protein
MMALRVTRPKGACLRFAANRGGEVRGVVVDCAHPTLTPG